MTSASAYEDVVEERSDRSRRTRLKVEVFLASLAKVPAEPAEGSSGGPRGVIDPREPPSDRERNIVRLDAAPPEASFPEAVKKEDTLAIGDAAWRAKSGHGRADVLNKTAKLNLAPSTPKIKLKVAAAAKASDPQGNAVSGV
ncbi:hypothetical protein QR680_012836 [Steinernema hermaphroditum]|uniref:Uncharacterized protein n=1 Tax=Steinernema hermaphroditum TaxID=289476 RepID=A0AA39I4T5_9BILA|nr:hypothetical protein QR680_012836 [Steinernema hermaphroditum]